MPSIGSERIPVLDLDEAKHPPRLPFKGRSCPARNAAHFGGPLCDYDRFAYAGTAAAALRQLDEAYERWVAGVRALGADGLARPCGPAEGPFADSPLAALVLHINREASHHGAEICLLRDLYRRRG